MDASVTQVSSKVLKVFFLPFLTPGHMIPVVDMARIFARHEVKATIIITPFNAKLFQNSIDLDIKSGYPISLHLLHFPAAEVGLPEGIENYSATKTPEHSQKLTVAFRLLQPQIEKFFRDNHPDCIVTDMFFPWTSDIAAELGIPRLYPELSSIFFHSAIHSMERYTSNLQSTTSEDSTIVEEEAYDFILPGLPHEIKMTSSQIPQHLKNIRSPYGDRIKKIRDSIPGCFGFVGNSFYELESTYIDHFKKVVNKNVWTIGPVSLCNGDTSDKTNRNGTESEHSCLSWLDSKKPNSVIYLSFGSMTGFGRAQLREIAFGLEASGHQFIWVIIRKPNGDQEQRWLPDGFEEKMKESGKGLIITTWAPQLLILEHPAIGGFVTHAGWNSILESICASVPMITWPFYADQLYNDKYVTQVLRIGVPVDVENKTWTEMLVMVQEIDEEKVTVTREKIEKAVNRLMDSEDEEIQQIRKRVRELGEIGKKAVEKGGSSYDNMTHLIQQIRLYGRSEN